jgi:tetratricopeptide (TPR) repeat protein
MSQQQDASEPHHDMNVVNNPKSTSAQQIHDKARKMALSKVDQNTASTPVGGTNDPHGDRHLTESGGEDLASILTEEVAAEFNLKQCYEKHGSTYNHPEVIAACLRMLESWILLYKLQPMDDLIEKIEGFAEAMSSKSDDDALYIKVLQMKAFMRFKQHRFKDALELFLKFKGLVGPSPELLENIGHTCNALGDDEAAVKYFQEAIKIQTIKTETLRATIRARVREDRELQRKQYKEEHNDEEPPQPSADELKRRENDEKLLEEMATSNISMQMGGLLLGVGTSLKKQGKLEESSRYLDQALQLYKKRFNNQDHSLIAKTLTSICDVCTKMNKHDAALEAAKEAVRIFKITCGVSPLTANALQTLGDCYITLSNLMSMLDPQAVEKLSQQQQHELVVKKWFFSVQAIVAYDEAFELHCGFDTPEFTQIIRLVQALLDNKTKLLNKPFPTPQSPPLQLDKAMKGYMPSIQKCLQTFKDLNQTNTDECAVLSKSFAEMLLLAGEFKLALTLLQNAKHHFQKVQGFDCSGLIDTCNGLIDVGIMCAKRDKIDLGKHDFKA